MLPPCLVQLDGDGPADPLVARERRYVFPRLLCLRVGSERLAEISREPMDDSSGDSNGRHIVISLVSAFVHDLCRMFIVLLSDKLNITFMLKQARGITGKLLKVASARGSSV
jgi:hypothetical protein